MRLVALLLAALPYMFVHPASAQTPVVRAILFYSPSCGHCHKVITEDIPLLWDVYGGEVEVYYTPPTNEEEELNPAILGLYGEQLEILYVNTWTPIGQELFGATIDRYNVAPEDQGVPLLVVADTYLVGSVDIPGKFPGIIAEGLKTGGIDWPDLTGLTDYISQLIPMAAPEETPTVEQGATSEPTELTQASPSPKPTAPNLPVDFENPEPSFLMNMRRDPLGNSISFVTLIGMVFIFLAVGVNGTMQLMTLNDRQPVPRYELSRAFPFLILVGIVVAGYMLYVEGTGTTAVCGPVGDCNTVQQSEYAMLFGVIPIGALGVFGNVALLLAWMVSLLKDRTLSNLAILALFGMTAFGTAFSIYLTFLEPFVIGATCAWCLTSAIVMTVMLWLTLDPAITAYAQLTRKRRR
jgi:uncharacterized membrane protein